MHSRILQSGCSNITSKQTMKQFIAAIALFTIVVNAWGQTNYYSQTKTFEGDGYTYQCDANPWGIIALYNKANKWVNKLPAYRSTGKTYIEPEDGFHPVMEHDAKKRKKCKDIVRNAFTEQQKLACKGDRLCLVCSINSDTGRIDEVVFEFFKTTGYVGIPISVFRQIELGLKKRYNTASLI